MDDIILALSLRVELPLDQYKYIREYTVKNYSVNEEMLALGGCSSHFVSSTKMKLLYS